MPRFDFHPAALRQEVADFERRLGAGLANLGRFDDPVVGACERDLVFADGRVALYRYRSLHEPRLAVPVVIVYALVNRPYMADLEKNRSLVQGLLERGLDLYLVDWGYPDGADRCLGLDEYINGHIDRCIDHVRAQHRLEAVNLLGICQGGTFSLCYAALNPAKIANLITTVTPVDFHTPDDMLSHLVRHIDIDLLVDAVGNVPGDMLNQLFLSLKPLRLAQQKYVDALTQGDEPAAMQTFMRMEKWIFDSPALAARGLAEFVKAFYQNNDLIKGKVRIGARTVALAALTMPVLNVYARDDHLVPPASSRALERYVGTKDYTAVEFPGGHIGIYVSTKARALIPDTVATWLRARPGRSAPP